MSTRHITTLAAIADAQPGRTDVLTAPAGTLLARYQHDSVSVREARGARGPIGAGQTVTIAPGQTYVLNTTIATGGVLLIDGNAPGMLTPGLVTTNNYGVNDGAIGIYGGSVPYSGAATSQSHTGGLFAVTGTFVNNGAISVAGGLGGYKASVPGGLINVTGIFINNGAIDLAGAAPHGHVGGSGALALNYGQLLSNTGLITVEGATGGIGARLQASGTFTNSGTIDVKGGLQLAGSPQPGETGVSGVIDLGIGTFTNSGTLTFEGGKSTTQGAGLGVGSFLFQNHIIQMTNTGFIELAGGYVGPSYNTGSTTGARLVEYGVITNNGSIQVDAGTVMGSAHGAVAGGIFFNSHGTLVNNGAITVQGSQATPGATPTGAGVGKFAEDGVLVNNSIITITGGNSANDAVGGFGGLLNVYGQQNTYGTGHLINYGTIIAAGGYRSVTATKAGTGGTLALSGGLTQNSGDIELQAGHVTPNGSKQVFGLGAQMVVIGGSAVNSGVIDVNGLAGPNSSAASLIDKTKLTNKGVINLTSVAGSATGAGSMTITATGTLIDTGTIAGGGTITNTGIIGSGLNGGAISTISAAAIVNTGTIQVFAANSFSISSNISAGTGGTGVFTIDRNGTLTLGGTVASNQQIDFIANKGTLAIGNAANFAGVLSGLQVTDVLDFLNQNVTSAIANGTTLEIGLSSGTTLDYALGAALPTGTALQLVSDQHGGTDVNIIKG